MTSAGLGLSVAALLPEIVVAGAALLLLLLDLAWRRGPAFSAGWGIAASLGALLALGWGPGGELGGAFGGQLVLDGLALAGRMLVVVVLALALASSGALLRDTPGRPADYVALLLFAAAGLMGVAASRHWLVLFIFLEMAALSTAALLATRSDRHAAREASLKYFILSAFASAFLLYGIALQFLSTGSFALDRAGSPEGAGALALLMVLAGLAFKCALVPFHMWAPDVYEGGPTPVAGFLAAASKATGFVVLARVLLSGAPAAPSVEPALAAVAALSMTVGTLLALAQRNIKRMLAYSGIAHAGYVATGLLAGGPQALPAVTAYLLIYALMTFGAFAVVAEAEAAGVEPDAAGFAGLGRRAPALAIPFAVFMISLTGLPPLGGFLAKFLVFREAWRAGHAPLVMLALAMSVVSVGFYLRLLVPVFMTPAPVGEAPLTLRPAGEVVVAVLALLVLAAGIAPGPLLAFAGFSMP